MFQYIINREDCARIDPQPGAVVLATEGEKMTLTIMEFEPGTVLPEHSHPHEQLGYMVEGRAVFTIDGKTYPVRAGQMWRLPGGVKHQVTVGDRPMRVVECFYPIREDFRAKEG
jgi:quercetin dioxygenase-like cupin family protein